jgi:hypothetical protein
MKTASLFSVWSTIGAAVTLMVQGASAGPAVHGEASSSGPLITVNVFADITTSPLVSFGFRLMYNPQVVSLQTAARNDAVWFLSDGTNQFSYTGPDTSTPGVVLVVGGKLDGLNPMQGVSGQHVLLGTATFTRLAPGPVQFSLDFARPAPFANFVTTAGDVLDGAVNGVALQGVTIDPNDTDLDGLPDAWEIAHFGSTAAYTWNDDPDHDGFNNLQEYQADTDPMNANSYLHMVGVSPSVPGAVIQWQGGVQATQYLQRSLLLDGAKTVWQDIATSAPPTAITGSYTDAWSTATLKFYRVRAGR